MFGLYGLSHTTTCFVLAKESGKSDPFFVCE